MHSQKEEINSVELLAVASRYTHYANVTVNDCMATFRIDSGAKVMVVPASFPGIPYVLDEMEGQLTGPHNQTLPVLRTFKTTLSWKSKLSRHKLYVTEAQNNSSI